MELLLNDLQDYYVVLTEGLPTLQVLPNTQKRLRKLLRLTSLLIIEMENLLKESIKKNHNETG